ncbi:MAG TPA: DinB family protein [Bryobacteraceae bacterium]|nr:DinB family protein [Bryobacteraceae bacterium]
MKLYGFLCVSLLAVSGLFAQGSPSQAAALQQAYNGIKNDIMQAAEKMPDSDYSFQPTMQERSFGGWVAHVADAQEATCARLAGTQAAGRTNPNGTKTELLDALKKSFEACDAAYNGTTDANANDAVQSFRGQTTRLASLWGNIGHDQECYGSMAVYLRLKNEVPPSTEMMEKMRGRGKKKE